MRDLCGPSAAYSRRTWSSFADLSLRNSSSWVRAPDSRFIRFISTLPTADTCSRLSRAKQYRYRTIDAPHGIAIKLSKYQSIDFQLGGSVLKLFPDTGASSSNLYRIKLILFNVICSFSLYELDLQSEYRVSNTILVGPSGRTIRASVPGSSHLGARSKIAEICQRNVHRYCIAYHPAKPSQVADSVRIR